MGVRTNFDEYLIQMRVTNAIAVAVSAISQAAPKVSPVAPPSFTLHHLVKRNSVQNKIIETALPCTTW